MDLDVRTIAFFVTLLSCLQTVVMLLYARLPNHYSGVIFWAAGSTLAAIGFFLVFLRGSIPEMLSVLIAHLLLAGTAYSNYLGARLFSGQEPAKLRGALLYCLLLLLLVQFAYIHPNQSAYTITFLLYNAFYYGMCAYLFFQTKEFELKNSFWFTGSIFAFYASAMTLFALVIGLYTFFAGSPSTQPNLQSSLLLSALFSPLWTAGFALMINQRLVKEMRSIAMTDYLTRTLNRWAAQEILLKELKEYRRIQKDFSVLLIDVDHFKSINDRFGHLTGDLMLKKVADVFRKHIRAGDMLCRWGGEEFMVILPGAGEHEAFQVAERLRQSIANMPVPVEQPNVFCTVSIGIARIDSGCVSIDCLITQSDLALYQAKRKGRNRTEVFQKEMLATEPESLNSASALTGGSKQLT